MSLKFYLKNKRMSNVKIRGIHLKTRISEVIAGYVALLPFIILMTVFLIYPIVYSFSLSFKDFSFFSPGDSKWVYLDNYINLFKDAEFLMAFKNTIIIVVAVVPVTALLSLIMAVLVNRKIKGRTFFRVAFFLPNVTSSVAVGTIIGFLFRQDSFITRFFHNIIGTENVSWFANVDLALPLVVIAMIFTFCGFYMLVYLAGLQEIPVECYETADISGAGSLRKFIYITLPMLRPAHFLVLIMLMINSFQAFDQSYVISTFGNSSIIGGPAGSTSTIVTFLYTNAFRYFKMGYASAAAFVLFVVIFIFTVVQKKLLDKPDVY